MRTIEVVNSFWKGDTLTWIERACIRSFLRHGIKFRLYTYGEVIGIPEGVEVVDASTISPAGNVFTYKGTASESSEGSPAIFSDMFRYLLQKENKGMWVDCDVYCVRSFTLADNPYIFGRQRPKSIACGVILLPSNSEMLSDLLGMFEQPYSIPSWLDQEFHNTLLEKYGTTEVHPSLLPWGSLGPRAVTALVEKYGLEEYALPIDVFYPVRLRDVDTMFDPDVDILGRLMSETLAIHLWNNVIRHRSGQMPDKGSFMHQLWLEGKE